jgi:DNA-binding transcriptional regulator GbsR (MarR family)
VNVESSHPLIDRMGRLLEVEGIPRTGGRIFGLLLFSDGAMSLDDIASHLGISKGGASGNVRLLEDRGLVQLMPKPGDRKDYYRIAPDGAAGPIRLALRRLRRVQKVLETGQQAGIPSPNARNRVRLGLSLYEHVLGVIEETLEEWGQRTKAVGG